MSETTGHSPLSIDDGLSEAFAQVVKDREARTADSVSVVSDGERIRADRDTLRAALKEMEKVNRAKAHGYEVAAGGKFAGHAYVYRSFADDLLALLQSFSESETP